MAGNMTLKNALDGDLAIKFSETANNAEHYVGTQAYAVGWSHIYTFSIFARPLNEIKFLWAQTFLQETVVIQFLIYPAEPLSAVLLRNTALFLMGMVGIVLA